MRMLVCVCVCSELFPHTRILECANLKGKDGLPNRLTANNNNNNNKIIISCVTLCLCTHLVFILCLIFDPFLEVIISLW